MQSEVVSQVALPHYQLCQPAIVREHQSQSIIDQGASCPPHVPREVDGLQHGVVLQHFEEAPEGLAVQVTLF